jgi:hypothetical protein
VTYTFPDESIDTPCGNANWPVFCSPYVPHWAENEGLEVAQE